MPNLTFPSARKPRENLESAVLKKIYIASNVIFTRILKWHQSKPYIYADNRNDDGGVVRIYRFFLLFAFTFFKYIINASRKLTIFFWRSDIQTLLWKWFNKFFFLHFLVHIHNILGFDRVRVKKEKKNAMFFWRTRVPFFTCLFITSFIYFFMGYQYHGEIYM